MKMDVHPVSLGNAVISFAQKLVQEVEDAIVYLGSVNAIQGSLDHLVICLVQATLLDQIVKANASVFRRTPNVVIPK